MAKTLFGNIIVDMRGKINGNVYAKNRSGTYSRAKISPTNPQTSFQSAVRGTFAALSATWRELTPEQRDAWNAAVNDWTRTNVFGQTVVPSGFSLFMRLNQQLAVINQAQIFSPPLPVEMPVRSISNVEVTDAPAAVITLDAMIPAGFTKQVLASPPMSAGVSNFGGRMKAIDNQSTTAASINVLAAYVARYGSIGGVGRKIGFEVYLVSNTTGQTVLVGKAAGIVSEV